MKTQKSFSRRMRAYWRHCKPTGQEVLFTGCFAAMILVLAFTL